MLGLLIAINPRVIGGLIMEQVEEAQTVNATPEGVSSPNPEDVALMRMAKLAPRPITMAETGLSENFLSDLFAKHMFHGGVLTISELGDLTALSGPVVKAVLDFMRRVEETTGD